MKKSQKQALAVGAGVAALAAAAAGTYFLTGKKGVKNRKKINAWVAKAKTEVVKQLEQMGNVTQKTYNKTVDAVMDKYQKLKNADKSEILQIAKELKGYWNSISKLTAKRRFNTPVKKITSKKTTKTNRKKK